MPNRTIAFAHVGLLLLSAFIAGLLLATSEASMATVQQSTGVWIREDDGSSSKKDIGEAVERVAEERNIAVGYAVPDVQSPESLNHLYLAVGDPDSKYAGWLEDGYPAFGHTMDIRVHPISDFSQVTTPRGFYLIYGPPENRPALEEALAAEGLSTGAGSMTTLWDRFAGGSMFRILTAALLVVVAAVGAGVLLDAKTYAVQRLQGRSYGRILAGDLARLLRLWAVALPAVAALTLGFLGFYNGWNQVDFYARLAFALLAVLAGTALATHAAVLAMAHATGVLPALNGRIPVRTTMASAYLVRVPVLVLVLAILGSIVSTAQSVREQGAALPAFDRVGDTARIALAGSMTVEGIDAAEAPVATWLREVDRGGEAVIAHQEPSDRILPPDVPPPDFDALVVNGTYLTEREVLSLTGERFRPVGPGGPIRVLLPEAHSDHREEIARGMRTWADFYSGDERDTPPVEIVPAADGQRLFTYGSQAPRGSVSAFADTPVVVALPNGTALSDRSYVNIMTNSALVFPDPGVVQEARRDPRMAEYINRVQPVRAQAAADYAAAVSRLRIEVFNLAAAGAVLLLTAVAASVIHVRARAQAIFARHISGWTFAATHRRFLALEAAVMLAFVGWYAWDTWSALQRVRATGAAARDDMAAITGLEPLYAAGIAATALACTLGALAVFHRRIVREGSSQA